MKIIIYGTGGVGGYFGAKLAQSGNDVTFIARGKHLDAIKKNGLQVKSIEGNYTVFPAKVTDNVAKISNPDLIIIATKTWQVASVAKKIVPIITDKTMVLPLLNGVTIVDELAKHIDKKNIIAGFCRIVSKIEGYGIINHVAAKPYLAFGELDNSKSVRIKELQKLFDNAKIENENPTDIFVAIWSKFLFITTISAIGGLTRVSLGAMRTNLAIRNMMQDTAQEVLEIANRKGVKITQKTIEEAFVIIDNMPFNTTASLQRDIMDGKPSELEAQVGTIHKMGQELKITTPISTFIYHSLFLQEKAVRNLK